MGQVFLAEHTRLGRKVALKVLKRRLVERPGMLRQFFDEARAASCIKHPAIVEVVDLVVEGDLAYMVMEYLPGKTLSQTLRESAEPLEPMRAMRIATRLAEALDAAHQAGILHLDVKPSNVLLVPREDGGESVKLMDFGASRLVREDEDQWAPVDTSPLFTPIYMSPEQGGGAEVDHRSDIYSLGVVLYEMLTGAPPFSAVTFAEYCYKHMKESPRRITSVRGVHRIPRMAATAVMRCLAKDPSDRFQSMAALGEVLSNPRMDSGRFRALSRGADPRLTPRRWPWLVVALGSVAVGVTLAALFWSSEGEQGSLASALAVHPAEVNPTQVNPTPKPEAVIRIASDPSGAEVYDIGPPRRLLGLTPLAASQHQLGQSRRLLLRMAGRDEQVITVVPGRSQTLFVSLPKAALARDSSLHEQSEPPAPAARPASPGEAASAPSQARPRVRKRTRAKRRADQSAIRAGYDGTVDPFR